MHDGSAFAGLASIAFSREGTIAAPTAELRPLIADWRELSSYVRFERAGGNNAVGDHISSCRTAVVRRAGSDPTNNRLKAPARSVSAAICCTIGRTIWHSAGLPTAGAAPSVTSLLGLYAALIAALRLNLAGVVSRLSFTATKCPAPSAETVPNMRTVQLPE